MVIQTNKTIIFVIIIIIKLKNRCKHEKIDKLEFEYFL